MHRFTAFLGSRKIGSGSLVDMARLIKDTQPGPHENSPLLFDDATGRLYDLDLRGSKEDVAALYEEISRRAEAAEATPDSTESADTQRGRGRPRLGVVAREITLLPRHWQWLNAQPGGASVALRKLVETARTTHADNDRKRAARDAAYHFIAHLAGDLPGFEDASRALFADQTDRFAEAIQDWPADVRDYALTLARRREEK